MCVKHTFAHIYFKCKFCVCNANTCACAALKILRFFSFTTHVLWCLETWELKQHMCEQRALVWAFYEVIRSCNNGRWSFEIFHNFSKLLVNKLRFFFVFLWFAVCDEMLALRIIVSVIVRLSGSRAFMCCDVRGVLGHAYSYPNACVALKFTGGTQAGRAWTRERVHERDRNVNAKLKQSFVGCPLNFCEMYSRNLCLKHATRQYET